MLGTYSDEFGKLDFERSQHGSGMSNRSQAKRFVSALSSVAERTYNNLFDLQQLRHIASQLQLRVSSSNHTLPGHPQLVLPKGQGQRHFCVPLCSSRNNQCGAVRLSRNPEGSVSFTDPTAVGNSSSLHW